MPSKIEIIGNDTEFGRLLNKNFVFAFRDAFVEVGTKKYCLPIYYQDYEAKIEQFPVRHDDVFVATHPKAGTTLASEMVWLIQNDLDYKEAKKYLQDRCPLLELPICYKNMYLNHIDSLENMKSPRVMRTHLPWPLMPESINQADSKAKIIYVKRNALDACVSYYHHCKLFEEHQGEFEQFCEMFLAGKVPFGPFWEAVLSYQEQSHRSNILILNYEDMVTDTFSVIEKVSAFLGKQYSPEQIKGLVDHLSFDSMKKNPAVNFENIREELVSYGLNDSKGCFIRRGKVGGYKSEMPTSLIEKFNMKIQEQFNNA